jgi:hypothetical protein
MCAIMQKLRVRSIFATTDSTTIALLFSMCYILSVRLIRYKRSHRMPAPSKRDKQSLKKYEQNKPVRTH